MFTDSMEIKAMSVQVEATTNGGSPPEFWAKLASDRIMHVADSAPEPIRDQALAFRSRMEKVVLFYMEHAIKSDRTTVCYLLEQAGHPELASLIRR